MTPLESAIAPTFIIFCRIGGCLMVAPGFSSERVPVRIRLYIAIGVTLALAPALIDTLQPGLRGADPLKLGAIIMGELTIGMFIGLLARLYFFALETLATAVAMTIGLGNIFGSALIEAEPAPALSTFVVICAIMLVFVTDQHLEMIRGLYLSYQTTPVFSPAAPESYLNELTRVLTQSYLLALRISSPFLLFGLIVNLAFGFLARLTPQVPVYFISGPFVIILGIYGFSIVAQDFFTAFSAQFGSWLIRG
ncbi:flagellar biosynthetic protein FliR [Methylocystis sp. WRRC1]|uniref:flagellar biosynthetic protein FliR n=1 Tax=Methylocystis sp. WRRC1 TaxID=1732014 RepID=UPI001D1436B0|nr:flagellar biosynthetic protein FliR [Methylocystis sp. WRRC1]MCC3244891.1 flagellar biosynthetic protein FliR [Methylocystis sp. WRRC1]